MKLKIAKIDFFIWLFYIELYLILLLSGSAFISVEQSLKFRPYLNLTINVIALFFSIYSVERFKKNSRAIVMITIVLGLFIILGSVNYSLSAISLIEDMISFLLFFMMVNTLKIKQINYEKVIFNIIFIISVLSLLIYFLVVILKLNISYTELGGKNDDIYYKNYFMLYSWTHRYSRPWNSFDRITSMFWEPGIYSIYLNYALFYILYRKKYEKKDKFPIIILCINIILTVSTTGWVLALILIALRLFNNTKYRKIAYIPMIMISIPLVIQILLMKKESNIVSYKLRIADLLEGLKLFIHNPILGVGYENVTAYSRTQDMVRGNSNGLVNWIYQTGLFGVSLMTIPFIILFRKMDNNQNRRIFLIFCFTYVMCNMTEPLTTRPFNRLLVAIVLCMGVSVRRYKNVKLYR